MLFHTARRLLALVALLCTALPAVAVEPGSPQTETCKRPEYPVEAQQAEEEGISVLGFLVGADGKVGRSVVLNSSGSLLLDEAAAAALSRCTFKPARTDGAPVESWVRVSYAWELTDEGRPAMYHAKRVTALAARKGNLAALYRFSLISAMTAKTDADREKALIVLASAAEQGHAHAQFDLGRHYEKGLGVEANLEEALRWYQKSAAQGDPLATQRLRLGILPD